jgi:endo-1,4-beta-D-glucanase Y
MRHTFSAGALSFAAMIALAGCDIGQHSDLGTSGSAGSAATAGSAGGGATGGSGGSSGGAQSAFPFPQEKRYAACSYPKNAGANDARKAYEAWKSELVTGDGAGGHLRVRRPNSPGGEVDSTVSEGIAYGMMLAVVMGDQPLFDALWQYTQLWLDERGLMHWYINAAGTMPLGKGGATDSDEDMAWALVMADKQWGGGGALGEPYIEIAKKQIERIWDHEVDHDHNDLLLPGDQWGAVLFNPSYFAPSEYRVFGEVTGKTAEWARVIDTGYAVIAKSLNAQSKNVDNGLVPAWCDENGVPTEPFAGGPLNYQYDSARMPFRLGFDYCVFNEPRAKAYLDKTNAFFAAIGAGNITDGYDLGGTPHPDPDSPPGSPQSAVFVGSAAVGAMSNPQYGMFVEDAYGRVATGELLARSRYYNLSWTALTLMMMSGNLVDYTHLEGAK